jgi:N-acetylmuramoyl-L-alanine amidase
VTEVPVPADAPVSDAIMESNDLEAVSADRPNPDEVTLEEAPLESVAPAAPSASADTPLGDGPLVLAIDPGHGGEDTGVVGPGGLVEKTLTLNVAQTLRRILKEEYGMATVITRDDDTYVSAPARLGAARSGNATLLLSLHGGASTAPGARGPHLFAHKPKRSLSIDPKPALGIARQLASTLYDAALGTAQPVREVPLRVVQNSSIPCVLVELGNLLHPDDESQLSSETYQFSLATALAQGVANAVGAQRASGSPS